MVRWSAALRFLRMTLSMAFLVGLPAGAAGQDADPGSSRSEDAAASEGETGVQVLEEMVVTASRTEQPTSEAQQMPSRVSGNP